MKDILQDRCRPHYCWLDARWAMMMTTGVPSVPAPHPSVEHGRGGGRLFTLRDGGISGCAFLFFRRRRCLDVAAATTSSTVLKPAQREGQQQLLLLMKRAAAEGLEDEEAQKGELFTTLVRAAHPAA